ncbi:MAG: DUF1993 domain-containing protein [Proteobacteria bacterium]|nr:DUF1993 domain-containing protein [Pseudomonadota bacterium]
MTLPLSRILLPAATSTLTNLRSWLDKPDARAKEAELLDARLAPDMFPFTRQYQIASDTVKGAAARLAGVEAPAMPDTEASFAELQARIDATLAFLATVDPAAIDAGAAREIELKFPNGGGMRFDGETYLVQFVLPNLYFHATAAYALLRGHGVAIGKPDFLAHLAGNMFAPPA